MVVRYEEGISMKLIELKLNKNLGWFLFLITFIVLIFIAINQYEIVREEYRDPELSTTWEDAIKLELNTKLKQANILLARYFNANEIIVTSYKDDYAGTLIFTAQIDGNIKQFYMLTDNEHLIEGPYSAHISHLTISSLNITKKVFVLRPTTKTPSSKRAHLKVSLWQRLKTTIQMIQMHM